MNKNEIREIVRNGILNGTISVPQQEQVRYFKKEKKPSAPAVPDPRMISLRDWFAGTVLPAVYASQKNHMEAAEIAYQLADAMLKKR